MRPKSLLLILVAVGCGFLAMWGATQGKGTEEQKTIPVLRVVAEGGINAHEPIRESMVEFIETPQSELLWDAITRKEDYEGKALSVAATKGEMLTKSKLTEKFNASTEIEEGKVVVTVKVDISTSHSGQIRPQDKVDVYTTYTSGQFGGAQGGTQTKTKRVLSRIEVFSIDSIRSSSGPGNEDVLAKTVSLLVDPPQASVLMMAQKKGEIHLALRNKTDKTEEVIPILTDAAFDKLESDEESLATEDKPDFKDSEEYKKMQKELEEKKALEEKYAKLLAAGKEKEAEEIKAAAAWVITVRDGSNQQDFKFEEETEEGATLPEASEGDSPLENGLNGESTTSQEGDQPMNTALNTDSGDK